MDEMIVVLRHILANGINKNYNHYLKNDRTFIFFECHSEEQPSKNHNQNDAHDGPGWNYLPSIRRTRLDEQNKTTHIHCICIKSIRT